MANDDKIEKLEEIRRLIHNFCRQYLNDELAGYALKLLDKIGRKKTFTITRGRNEIWAAAIVHVIARLNFLFDREQEYFITADTICDFFNTKKTTVGNKATQIEKTCNIELGAEGFCNPEITDMLTFVQTPDGFVFPKSLISNHEIVVEFVDGKEAEELENYIEEHKRRKIQEAAEKKARRAEINRKKAEDKKKQIQKNQLSLFDELNQ